MIFINLILPGIFFTLSGILLMTIQPLLLSAWIFSLSTIIALGFANIYFYKFQNLKYFSLLRYVKIWRKEFKDVPIKSIILYKFYSKHRKEFEQHENFGELKTNYTVIFELDCSEEDFEIETIHNSNIPCRKFISDAEHYWTLRNHPKHVAFMDSSFHEVYKEPPPIDDFRDEWDFVPIKCGEKPSNVLIKRKWILYPLIRFLK